METTLRFFKDTEKVNEEGKEVIFAIPSHELKGLYNVYEAAYELNDNGEYELYTHDEADFSEGTEMYDFDGENYILKDVSEIGTQVGEVYEYWDGNNWKSIIISDIYPTSLEEVTEEFEGFDSKSKLLLAERNGSTSDLYVYMIKDDEGNRKIVTCNSSRFQGSFDEYEVENLEKELQTISDNDSELLAFLVREVNYDVLFDNIPEIQNHFGEDLRATDSFIFSKDDLELVDEKTYSNDTIGVDTYTHLPTNKKITLSWSSWHGDRDTWEIAN